MQTQTSWSKSWIVQLWNCLVCWENSTFIVQKYILVRCKCSSCEIWKTKILCYDLLQSQDAETLFFILVIGSCSPERPRAPRLVSHNLWKPYGTSNQSGCYVNFSIVEPFQTNTSTQSFSSEHVQVTLLPTLKDLPFNKNNNNNIITIIILIIIMQQ